MCRAALSRRGRPMCRPALRSIEGRADTSVRPTSRTNWWMMRANSSRPRDRAQVTGALEHDGVCVRDQPKVLGRALDRHDVVEMGLAGDDERWRGDSRAVGRDVLGRDHARPGGDAGERYRRTDGGAQRAQRKSSSFARVGDRGSEFRAQTERRFGEEDRAENPRRAQVELVPRPQTQQRSRSRCQNQRVASCRIAGRKPDGDKAAERHAANRRPIDAGPRHHVRHVVGVAVQVAGTAARTSARETTMPTRRPPGACTPTAPEDQG